MNYTMANGHTFTREATDAERHANRMNYDHGFREPRTTHTALASGLLVAHAWNLGLLGLLAVHSPVSLA